MVKISVPATTANLGPGFDCLGLALDLLNTVEMIPAIWDLSITGLGQNDLPCTRDNLVWRAALRLWKEVGINPPEVKVLLHNTIPLSRGLGSSSAAIVGGLVAANCFVPNPCSNEILLRLAAELEGHPDNVAPALLGGFVASAQDGGTVLSRVLPLSPSLKFVVCIPDFHLSTAEARRVLPNIVPHRDAVKNVSRAVLMVQAMQRGDGELLAFACADMLHQPYRKSLIPGFDAVRESAHQAGAVAAMISGAGPTMLAIVTDGNPQRVGTAMEQAFAERNIKSAALVLKPSFAGASII